MEIDVAIIEKLERNASILEKLKSDLTTQQKSSVECTSEKGASNWLSALPLQKYDIYLDKQSFRDDLFLRHDIMLPKLPLNCVCGRSFNVNHDLSCATGGFVTIRHSDVRDLTGELLKEVCNDVELEPELSSLSKEELANKTSNKADGARVDVSARGFWQRGRKTVLDVRVFNTLAKSHLQARAIRNTYIKINISIE